MALRLRGVSIIDARKLAEQVGEAFRLLEGVAPGCHVDRPASQEAHCLHGVERRAAHVRKERKHVVLGHGGIEIDAGAVVGFLPYMAFDTRTGSKTRPRAACTLPAAS